MNFEEAIKHLCKLYEDKGKEEKKLTLSDKITSLSEQPKYHHSLNPERFEYAENKTILLTGDVKQTFHNILERINRDVLIQKPRRHIITHVMNIIKLEAGEELLK